MAIDRIFLRLGPNGALGADDLQWILYRAKRDVPIDAPLALKDWQPVSYVRSEKAILLRCVREKGVLLTDAARLVLESYPYTFDEWKAAQSAPQSPLHREYLETIARDGDVLQSIETPDVDIVADMTARAEES